MALLGVASLTACNGFPGVVAVPLDLGVPVLVGEISPLARVSSMAVFWVTVSTPRGSPAPSRVDAPVVDAEDAGS